MRDFVQRFNESDFLGKASLAIKHLKPEPDQALAIPLRPGGKYQSVHFVGYAKEQVGICYVATGDNRIPLCSFNLYPDGDRSFNSFVRHAGNTKFAEPMRRQFMEAFDGLIRPSFLDN